MCSWKFMFFTDEIPIKFFKMLMIRDVDTSRNCAWNRWTATLEIRVFARIGWRCYNPAWPWSRCVNFNVFGAFVKGSIFCFIRSWRPLAMKFISLLKLLLRNIVIINELIISTTCISFMKIWLNRSIWYLQLTFYVGLLADNADHSWKNDEPSEI